MISAVVVERIEHGAWCRLEPGTLNLRNVRQGEDPVFSSSWALNEGDEVWLVPLDSALIEMHQGLPVRGAARAGTGGSTTVIPPSQGGS
jgi:hypothetical protein